MAKAKKQPVEQQKAKVKSFSVNLKVVGVPDFLAGKELSGEIPLNMPAPEMADRDVFRLLVARLKGQIEYALPEVLFPKPKKVEPTEKRKALVNAPSKAGK